MPTTCAAFGCSNNSRVNQVTFHRFPSNPERRKQWLNLVNRENFTPSLHTFLCSKHFEESCFDRTGQTVRLRTNAVPTIFIYPEHMVEKIALTQVTVTKPGENPPSGSTTDIQKNSTSYGDHSYCLPRPAEIKRKIWDLERKLEIAHKKIKIYQQRERRGRRKCLTENFTDPVLDQTPEQDIGQHKDNMVPDPKPHKTVVVI
ncbi:THAP domain-containing protein 2-like [Bufo bufo]|uniref:THAP domain-containing protein 2-like n=1 Tax=Bufo bufo TaxID=8384 RepID=UPI001ABDE0B0|nr:THAP domain-containing protein 2-like [Bufo bufo]